MATRGLLFRFPPSLNPLHIGPSRRCSRAMYINTLTYDPVFHDEGYSDGETSSLASQPSLSPPLSPCSISPPHTPVGLCPSQLPPSNVIYYCVQPSVEFILVDAAYLNEYHQLLLPSDENVNNSVQQHFEEPATFAKKNKRVRVDRLIKWSLPPPLTPWAQLPEWDPMPFSMEHFWQSAFAHFFRPFFYGLTPHVWTLTPTPCQPPADEWIWHTVKYSAKVRFMCSNKHGFTSLKGVVVFWYRMRRYEDQIVTEAKFKLFGQKCNRCRIDQQEFLPALWYHKEIENAMQYLAQEVSKTYYGGEHLPAPRRVRQGNPNPAVHHDSTRCQACTEGICVVRF